MVVLQVRVDASSARHFFVVHDESLPLVDYIPEIARELGLACDPVSLTLWVGDEKQCGGADSVSSLGLGVGAWLVIKQEGASQRNGPADYTGTAPVDETQEQGWHNDTDDFGYAEPYDNGNEEDSEFYQLETIDQGVYDVLCRSEGYLQEVFHYYALLSLPHDRICFADFRRFVRDFRLLTLVSMQEVSDVVKATIGTDDIVSLQMRYPEYILCLEALAMIGYSRHPYGDMRMTSEDKMERLLILMVGSEGSKRVEQSMEGGRSLRRWISPLFVEHSTDIDVIDPLDDESRERLKSIFLYYSSFNESQSLETMLGSQFRMFCRDCSFIAPRDVEKSESRSDGGQHVLKAADVDVIYVQAVKDQERKATEEARLMSVRDSDQIAEVKDAYMNFEGFQDSVVMLSVKAKPDLPVEDAVREVLRDTVYRQAGATSAPVEEPEEWDAEMLSLFQKAKKPLKGIFDVYAKLRTGHTTIRYKYLTMESFFKFALDFHLCPMWLSKPELAEIFRSVCANNDVEHRLESHIKRKGGQVAKARKQLLFQFPEFIDALAMCALEGLGKEPHCEMYPTAVEKVEVLLTQMEASEAKQRLKLPLLIRSSSNTKKMRA